MNQNAEKGNGSTDDQVARFLQQVAQEAEASGVRLPDTMGGEAAAAGVAPRPTEAEMHQITIEFWRAEVQHLEAQAGRARRLGLDQTIQKIESSLPYARKMLRQAEGASQ